MFICCAVLRVSTAAPPTLFEFRSSCGEAAVRHWQQQRCYWQRLRGLKPRPPMGSACGLAWLGYVEALWSGMALGNCRFWVLDRMERGDVMSFWREGSRREDAVSRSWFSRFALFDAVGSLCGRNQRCSICGSRLLVIFSCPQSCTLIDFMFWLRSALPRFSEGS